MNTECLRIADQLDAAINGEAWYGDSVRQILDKVTAKEALAHPIQGAHSIWEILLHVEAWVTFSSDAVHGTPIPPWPAMPKEDDWPVVHGKSEQEWQQSLASFFSNHQRLTDEIRGCKDERLDSTVPGRTYGFYHLFQSATQHAIYHAGQIALLKKALRTKT